MEERTLELNVISAQNLKKVKNFGHQTCFAVVYIASSNKKASKVDKDGGVNPTWNDKLTVTCDEKLLRRGRSYITVDIYSHGTFSNKLVGTSKISLLEIGKQAAAAAPPKFLSFDVRRRSGTESGVLNVSVKVGEKRYIAEKNHTGKPFLGFCEGYRRQHLQEAVPMGYPAAVVPPTSCSPTSETRTSSITPYPHPYAQPMPSRSMIVYPTSGYRSAYPPQHCDQQSSSQCYGTQYASALQPYSYRSTQITPQKYQKHHYAKPTRRRSGYTRCPI